MRTTSHSERVLLVQLADIGDLLLAAPAIQHLRRSRPSARLTLLCKPTTAGVASGLVDEVVAFDKHLFDRPSSLLRAAQWRVLFGLRRKLRRQAFDEVVLLHHLVSSWGLLKFALLTLATGARVRRGPDSGRGWFLTHRVRDLGFGARHESAYWDNLLGGSEPPAIPVDRAAARALLRALGVPGPYAVVHPGSGAYSTARRWPVERFSETVDALARSAGLTAVVVGGKEEAALAAAVVEGHPAVARDASGRTELPVLAGLLAEADVFLGNDAGVAQLAAVVGTPSVVIFGPSNHNMWGPRHNASRIVRLDLPCSPCFYRYGELGTPGGCSTRECLLDLSVDRVVQATLDLLDGCRAG